MAVVVGEAVIKIVLDDGSLKKAEDKAKNNAEKIANAYNEITTAVGDVIGKVIETTAKFLELAKAGQQSVFVGESFARAWGAAGAILEKQAQAMLRYKADLTSTEQVLIRMKALDLTREQSLALIAATSERAASLGKDEYQSIQQVVLAMEKGEKEGLAQLGIHKSISDEMNNAGDIYNYMVTQSGKLTFSQSQAGDAAWRTSTAWADLVSNFTVALSKSTPLESTFSGIAKSIEFAANHMDRLVTILQHAAPFISPLGLALQGFQTVDIVAKLRALEAQKAAQSQGGGAPSNEIDLPPIDLRTFKDFTGGARPKGKSAETSLDDIMGPAFQQLQDAERLKQMLAEAIPANEAPDPFAGMKESLREMPHLTEGLLSALDGLNPALEQMVADNQEIEGTWKNLSNVGDRLTQLTVEGIAGGLLAVVKGEKSFGQAMKGMVSSLASAAAQMGLVEGMLELGRGFAAMAMTWGTPNPKALAHFTAAGILFGIGALGLGVAGAMGGGGAGAGASAASFAPQPASATESTQPTIQITQIYNGPMVGTMDEYAVATATAMEDARLKGLLTREAA